MYHFLIIHLYYTIHLYCINVLYPYTKILVFLNHVFNNLSFTSSLRNITTNIRYHICFNTIGSTEVSWILIHPLNNPRVLCFFILSLHYVNRVFFPL